MGKSSSNRIETAIILAAGRGSRMDRLTQKIPKPLIEINGKAILEQTLNCLAENSFKQAVLVIGYLGEAVIGKFGSRIRKLKIK